mmetsp:Transcript_14161/g.16733  ORF Transcript_14161/g.16733 Transcript_14161/m.16733 type:complete len:322 (-) Transcript_14161:32-997(-)
MLSFDPFAVPLSAESFTSYEIILPPDPFAVPLSAESSALLLIFTSVKYVSSDCRKSDIIPEVSSFIKAVTIAPKSIFGGKYCPAIITLMTSLCCTLRLCCKVLVFNVGSDLKCRVDVFEIISTNSTSNPGTSWSSAYLSMYSLRRSLITNSKSSFDDRDIFDDGKSPRTMANSKEIGVRPHDTMSVIPVTAFTVKLRRRYRALLRSRRAQCEATIVVLKALHVDFPSPSVHSQSKFPEPYRSQSVPTLSTRNCDSSTGQIFIGLISSSSNESVKYREILLFVDFLTIKIGDRVPCSIQRRVENSEFNRGMGVGIEEGASLA